MWPSQSPDLGGNTSSTDRLQLIWALELVRVRMKRGPTSALTPITSITTTTALITFFIEHATEKPYRVIFHGREQDASFNATTTPYLDP